MIALIGLILLIGIVKKNAIMMIDVALDTGRRDGLPPDEAIRRASLLRLRPILMTTMAALLGALPMAINTGTGAELRRPLGITIIGGLLVSQVLTLYTTPALYLVMARLRIRLIQWRSWIAGGGGYQHGLTTMFAGTAALACGSLLSACTVAPPYVRPQVPTPPAYKEQAFADSSSFQPAVPSDRSPRAAWWERLGDDQLNDIEAQMGRRNPTLAQADAQFRQARALVRQDRAAYFPTVTGSASIVRTRPGAGARTITAGSTALTDYALSADFSWEADLWGRVRQTVAAGTASAQAAAADLENTRLSLSAELAADYFQLRSLDTELALFDDTIAAYQRALLLTQNQYDAGIVSRADVEQAETQLASAQAQAVDVRLQRDQFEHALAVLTGDAPATVSIAPMPLAGDPPAVPSDVPSRLLERRPDIAAAERRVAAANAQIGVASSAFFPAVTLGATAGFESTRLEQWLSWPARFWSVGPALAATLFDGGARRAAKEAAVAAYDETVAAYRQTVLAAFQDVEDDLAAQRLLADESEREQAAVVAAQRSLDISMNQYRAGLVSYLQVATQQTALLASQRAAVSLTARRFVAAVQLVRALGGGWDPNQRPTPNSQLPTPNSGPASAGPSHIAPGSARYLSSPTSCHALFT